MPTDQFTLSVTNSVRTDGSNLRPWKFKTIKRIQVVAPAAATAAEWTLRDGSDVPFNANATHGIAVSYEANAFTEVEMIPENEWQLILFHTGASAQTFTMIVEWE